MTLLMTKEHFEEPKISCQAMMMKRWRWMMISIRALEYHNIRFGIGIDNL
jgi:hypothetical protein